MEKDDQLLSFIKFLHSWMGDASVQWMKSDATIEVLCGGVKVSKEWIILQREGVFFCKEGVVFTLEIFLASQS